MSTFSISKDPDFVGLQCDRGARSDVVQYYIRCTSGSATDGAAQLFLESQFPNNTLHPDIGSLIVVKQAITQIKAPNSLWVGQVSYAPPAGLALPSPSDNTALLSLPARVESIRSEFYQEVSEYDIYGDPIINSAGDPNDPSGTVDLVRTFLLISKYKQSFIGDTYAPFEGALNSTSYKVPGLGTCVGRSLRCLYVSPATGFNATVTIPATISGTFSLGDALTWPGGGTATAVSSTTGALVIENPSISVAGGTIITGPTGTATATSTVVLPPVKVLWLFERRLKKLSDGTLVGGFDYEQLDKGSRAYWQEIGGTKGGLAHIFTKKDHTEVVSPVLLRKGAPAVQADYEVNNPKFNAWSTSYDALDARVTAGKVGYRESTYTPAGGGPAITMVFLKFKRIPEIDFSGIGL